MKAIIDGLRCSSETDIKCKHEECAYWTKCTESEVKEFIEEHPDANISDDFFAGCDCDPICKDAADQLEGFMHTGEKVLNKRSGTHGIVIREFETGQILVCESTEPYVFCTHDSWDTLEVIE